MFGRRKREAALRAAEAAAVAEAERIAADEARRQADAERAARLKAARLERQARFEAALRGNPAPMKHDDGCDFRPDHTGPCSPAWDLASAAD